MRSHLVTTLLLLFTTALAGSEERAIADFPADKVAANTYVIHGPMGQPNAENKAFINNPAFVVTPAGVVVVDPGSSLYIGDMLLRQIRKVTDKPVVAVLNTHVHGDHWLGNDAMHRAYPQAVIYAHPRMIEAVQAGAGDDWIRLFNRLTENATEGTRVAAPSQPLNDGDLVEIGGFQFKIHYYDQAHTSTDIMIEVPEEDLLFTGDNANNGRIVRMDDGNFRGNIAALDKALELNVSTYVPGHGRSGGRELVLAYRAYLQDLYGKVTELFDEDLSDFEMKDQVHAQLEPFHTWTGYDTELGKHISLAYLEVEAAAF